MIKLRQCSLNYLPKEEKGNSFQNAKLSFSPEKSKVIQTAASIGEDDDTISENLEQIEKLNRDLEIKEVDDLHVKSYEKGPLTYYDKM